MAGGAVTLSVVLASTSRYRYALLSRLGLPFTVYAPACDESYAPGLSPEHVAQELAERKARVVASAIADERAHGAQVQGGDGGRVLIIGSDQVVDLDGEILGKPGTRDAALTQLQRLSGRTHRLITAVAVCSVPDHRAEVAVDVHTLTMRSLSAEALGAYLEFDAPYDCAGSYKLESRGIALFERVLADPDTADDTAIVGLPLMKLCRLLRGFGVDPLAPGCAMGSTGSV